MHKHFAVTTAAIVAGALGAVAACSSDTCLDDNTCAALEDGGAVGEGGADVEGGADEAAVPPGCDPSADVKDSPGCVTDSYGVFVDGINGLDTNAGTKGSPVKTIGSALGKLGSRSRVYVCGEGPYAEHVKVSMGVALAGGFACGTWAYTGAKAKVAPTDAGYGLEVTNASDAYITDLAFEAMAGTAERRSSIAVFVARSTVRFARMTASANAGHDGESGTTGSNYDPSLTGSSPLLRGKAASGTSGGPQQECAGLCTNGIHSTGGKGGNGTNTPSAGEPGLPALGAGAGGLAGVCNPTMQNGNAAAAASNAAAATSFGTLTEAGWAPSDGPAGSVGGPGQGGGGGGGGADPAEGGGGGGGCGGCGGAPGSAAQGGGASVALVSFESTVTLHDAVLTSAKAGNGGAGAAGQPGQVGGAGGNPSALGCQGGKGGAGGAGGASAGGAGGVSAAVVYKGSKPTAEGATSLTPGTQGDKGFGGKQGTNDGPEGAAAAFVEAP